MRKILLVSLYVSQVIFWNQGIWGMDDDLPVSKKTTRSVSGKKHSLDEEGLGGARPAKARKRFQSQVASEGSTAARASASTSTHEEDGPPSPTCQSGPGGCYDPRVYRRNFKLTYDAVGSLGLDAEEWYENKKKFLMDVCEALGEDRGRSNLVIGGLKFIYEKTDGILAETEIIDLEQDKYIPHIFTSGGTANPLEPVTIRGVIYPFLSVNDIYVDPNNIPRGPNGKRLTKADIVEILIREEMKQQRERSGSTKLSQRRLDGWYKEDQEAINLQTFSHSEVGLRRYLKQKAGKIIQSARDNLPKDSEKILKMLIYVVSINDMCRNCATSYFLDSEQGELAEIFKRALRDQGYQIKDSAERNNPFILSKAFGLSIYDEPAKDHEDKQVPYLEIPISMSNFSPHVAHWYLHPIEGGRGKPKNKKKSSKRGNQQMGANTTKLKNRSNHKRRVIS